MALTEAQQKHLKLEAEAARGQLAVDPDPAAEALRRLTAASRTVAGMVNIQTTGGPGTLQMLRSGRSLVVVATCRLKNGLNFEIVFALRGDGVTTHRLKPGKHGRYTVQGELQLAAPADRRFGPGRHRHVGRLRLPDDPAAPAHWEPAADARQRGLDDHPVWHGPVLPSAVLTAAAARSAGEGRWCLSETFLAATFAEMEGRGARGAAALRVDRRGPIT